MPEVARRDVAPADAEQASVTERVKADTNAAAVTQETKEQPETRPELAPPQVTPASLEAQLASDDALAMLENLLLPGYKRRVAQLETELERLRIQTQDHAQLIAIMSPVIGDILEAKIREGKDEMAETIAPLLGGAIRVQIRDSQDDFVGAIAPVMSEAIRSQVRDAKDDVADALYPVIGQTIRKAVTEAISDLARNIDNNMRRTLDVRSQLSMLSARLRGVSQSDLIFRQSIPFSVEEVFFIHRESGLLIAHLSHTEEETSDSDLVSGMLTAIRDFARDSFGRGKEGELNEIQYGDYQIMLEPGQYAYIAIVVSGVSPSGFRSYLRDVVSALHRDYHQRLRNYDGMQWSQDDAVRTLRGALIGAYTHKEEQ